MALNKIAYERIGNQYSEKKNERVNQEDKSSDNLQNPVIPSFKLQERTNLSTKKKSLSDFLGEIRIAVQEANDEEFKDFLQDMQEQRKKYKKLL